MNKYTKLFGPALLFIAFSCGNGDELEGKKEALEALKKESMELRNQIETLEREIAEMDPEFANTNVKTVLITTVKPNNGRFQHFVEVTGSVLSKKNVNISGEVSGRIQEITAVEGMRVNKGQVLARIDAESIQRNIDELEKQLELALIIFEKQERLWNQQIGTEVQYLEAKNRKESLEKSLASLKTQEDRTVVRAPFDGTVETVLARTGELILPGSPILNFVGMSDLYIEGDVSERYVGILNRGDSVDVTFPSINESLKSRVSAIGSVINPNNRTFKVEVVLPANSKVKPNMVAVLKVRDYESSESITVPVHLVQRDNKGDFVYVVENSAAKKKYITRGVTYKNYTEIKDGLKGSELLVDKGFNEVGEGIQVTITE